MLYLNESLNYYIDKQKENWKVKIRVSRMWHAINSKNNEIISLDMILIDEPICFSFIVFNIFRSLYNLCTLSI